MEPAAAAANGCPGPWPLRDGTVPDSQSRRVPSCQAAPPRRLLQKSPALLPPSSSLLIAVNPTSLPLFSTQPSATLQGPTSRPRGGPFTGLLACAVSGRQCRSGRQAGRRPQTLTDRHTRTYARAPQSPTAPVAPWHRSLDDPTCSVTTGGTKLLSGGLCYQWESIKVRDALAPGVAVCNAQPLKLVPNGSQTSP